jgi:hypothetical protein
LKSDFTVVDGVPLKEAKLFLGQHHYLGDACKSGFNVGLYQRGTLVGICIFTGIPAPELAKGMFGLERNQQNGLFELSRLCLRPDVQALEHNMASWFVARALRLFKRSSKVCAVLSYADADYHEGTVYRACGFTYYGMSAAKKDFWIKQPDGGYVKHQRGKVRGLDGEWRDRSRKHRFVMLYDKSLDMKWGVI